MSECPLAIWYPSKDGEVMVFLMKLPAPDELLDRYAAALVALAASHGLSNLRHGGPGTIIADVERGRTFFDLANFELEAESLLGHEVFVMSSDAPAAQTPGKNSPPLRAVA